MVSNSGQVFFTQSINQSTLFGFKENCDIKSMH